MKASRRWHPWSRVRRSSTLTKKEYVAGSGGSNVSILRILLSIPPDAGPPGSSLPSVPPPLKSMCNLPAAICSANVWDTPPRLTLRPPPSRLSPRYRLMHFSFPPPAAGAVRLRGHGAIQRTSSIDRSAIFLHLRRGWTNDKVRGRGAMAGFPLG